MTFNIYSNLVHSEVESLNHCAPGLFSTRNDVIHSANVQHVCAANINVCGLNKTFREEFLDPGEVTSIQLKVDVIIPLLCIEFEKGKISIEGLPHLLFFILYNDLID